MLRVKFGTKLSFIKTKKIPTDKKISRTLIPSELKKIAPQKDRMVRLVTLAPTNGQPVYLIITRQSSLTFNA